MSDPYQTRQFFKMIKLIDILNEIGLPGDLATLKELNDTIKLLSGKKKVLLLATSNRYELPNEPIDVPKSTQLALAIQKSLGEKAILMDVSKLKIHHCEGNVSRKDGNSCGVKDAVLKDKEKDPSGYHRCWASINNSDDELWKISKELFECDAVVFFASVRWGQANAFYQTLIERLTWIENRHSTLQEDNVVKDIDSGFICIGQNWNGEVVVETQKKVHEFYGFKTPEELYWNWQYTKDSEDESEESYVNSIVKFKKDFNIK
jgi:multimeric flavodoxin WrbA